MIETNVDTRYTTGIEYETASDPTIEGMSPADRDLWAARLLDATRRRRLSNTYVTFTHYRHGTPTRMVIRTFDFKGIPNKRRRRRKP